MTQRDGITPAPPAPGGGAFDLLRWYSFAMGLDGRSPLLRRPAELRYWHETLPEPRLLTSATQSARLPAPRAAQALTSPERSYISTVHIGLKKEWVGALRGRIPNAAM
jgi:hypothetical protein